MEYIFWNFIFMENINTKVFQKVSCMNFPKYVKL